MTSHELPADQNTLRQLLAKLGNLASDGHYEGSMLVADITLDGRRDIIGTVHYTDVTDTAQPALLAEMTEHTRSAPLSDTYSIRSIALNGTETGDIDATEDITVHDLGEEGISSQVVSARTLSQETAYDLLAQLDVSRVIR